MMESALPRSRSLTSAHFTKGLLLNSPLSLYHVAASGQYGGFMVRVHQFDPWSRERCVNSSITGDTSQADAQWSAERLIHLSLRPLAALRSPESAPESVHSREQESRSSQDSPLIHGL